MGDLIQHLSRSEKAIVFIHNGKTQKLTLNNMKEMIDKIKQLEAVKKYAECWHNYQKQFAEITFKNGKLVEENQRLREALKMIERKCDTGDVTPMWLRHKVLEIARKALEE